MERADYKKLPDTLLLSTGYFIIMAEKGRVRTVDHSCGPMCRDFAVVVRGSCSGWSEATLEPCTSCLFGLTRYLSWCRRVSRQCRRVAGFLAIGRYAPLPLVTLREFVLVA